MAPNEAPPQFVTVAPLYDLLMMGVPYTAWILYLRQLLDLWNAHPRTVLDLACGTGNVSELLYHEGYDVVGVDIAPAMIEVAKQKAATEGFPIEYFVQDAAELSLPKRRFDLCTCLFDSLNYILEPARLQMAFEQVYAHLAPRGVFIFDMNSEFALINNFFDQENLEMDEPLKYDWHSTYVPSLRICRVEMDFNHTAESGEVTHFQETHLQFAYRTEEVLEMLNTAGFEKCATYQAYTLRSPSKTSDRIFYVARKPSKA